MATRRVVPMAARQMKVAQISKPGAGFQIVEREVPEPGAGLCRIRRFGVDVKVRSEFLCKAGIFGAASDGRDFIAKLICKLNSEMTETANTLHGNEVAGQCIAVPQRVVSCNSGTQQRRCVGSA